MCNNSQACILISLFLLYVSHINVFLPSNSLSPPCLCVCVCVCLIPLSSLQLLTPTAEAAGNVSFSLSFPPSFALNACPGNYTAFLSFFFGFVSMSVYKSPISFYHSVTVSVLTTRGWSFSPRSPDRGVWEVHHLCTRHSNSTSLMDACLCLTVCNHICWEGRIRHGARNLERCPLSLTLRQKRRREDREGNKMQNIWRER